MTPGLFLALVAWSGAHFPARRAPSSMAPTPLSMAPTRGVAGVRAVAAGMMGNDLGEVDGSMVDRIVDLADQDYVNKASRMLQAMERQRVALQGVPKPEVARAYKAVWDCSERTRRWGLLVSLYQRISAEEGLLHFTDGMYDTALFACERQADGVLAEAILRAAGESPERFNRAIRARTKQLEVTDAVRLYRELQQRGWGLETGTVNLMMQVCFAIKQVAYSLKLFSAMRALGVAGDDRTYTIAIRAATQAKREEGGGWVVGLRLLNAMRAKVQNEGMPVLQGAPVVPSAFCFGAVIRSLASAGEADKAVSVLKQMVKAKHTPDAPLFATVTRACAARGNLEDAFRVFSQMQTLNVRPELQNVAALLLACERCSNGRKAVSVLEMAPQLGLGPTTLTYNMAMSACAKSGDLGLVRELLAKMDAGGEDVRPDIVTLNTVLDAYKRAHQWEGLLEFLLEMETERGIAPDTVSVNTAIKACKDEGQYDLALQLFDGMGARGLAPDSVSFAEVIAACGKAEDWERALSVFEAARQSPVALNTFIYNAIVGAAVACDKSETALELIKAMRAAGFSPDVVTFTTVITMCSRKEEWEAVVFLAHELETSGLALTKPLVNQLQRATAALNKDRKGASV